MKSLTQYLFSLMILAANIQKILLAAKKMRQT